MFIARWSLIAYTYPSAAIALVPVALIVREPIPTTAVPWIGIIALALCTQMIGHTALAASLRYFRPSVVAFAGLLTPIVASLSAVIFLHEAMSMIISVSGLVLLAAVAIVLADETQANTKAAIAAAEL